MIWLVAGNVQCGTTQQQNPLPDSGREDPQVGLPSNKTLFQIQADRILRKVYQATKLSSRFRKTGSSARSTQQQNPLPDSGRDDPQVGPPNNTTLFQIQAERISGRPTQQQNTLKDSGREYPQVGLLSNRTLFQIQAERISGRPTKQQYPLSDSGRGDPQVGLLSNKTLFQIQAERISGRPTKQQYPLSDSGRGDPQVGLLSNKTLFQIQAERILRQVYSATKPSSRFRQRGSSGRPNKQQNPLPDSGREDPQVGPPSNITLFQIQAERILRQAYQATKPSSKFRQ